MNGPGNGVAEEINLLHEGATAVAHISGDSDIAMTAKAAAERILDVVQSRQQGIG